MGQLVRAAEEDQPLADMNADFGAPGQDPKARAAYEEEPREWDAMLRDGLGATGLPIAAYGHRGASLGRAVLVPGLQVEDGAAGPCRLFGPGGDGASVRTTNFDRPAAT